MFGCYNLCITPLNLAEFEFGQCTPLNFYQCTKMKDLGVKTHSILHHS